MELGTSKPLSLGRKLLIEHCHFSDATQKGVIKRRITIGPLLAALDAAANKKQKPQLPLVFIKAFALVARDLPELRRSYIKFPWPQFYDLDYSVAMMPVTRDLDGEEIVLIAQFRDPIKTPMPELVRSLRHMKTAPLRSIKSFDRSLKIAALPFPLRRLAFWLGLNVGRHRRKFFGTFAISAMGRVEPIYTIHPLTSMLTYGVLDTAKAEVDVALSFDHRVYDGMTVVRALDALEVALNGPVATEIAGSD